MGKEENEGAHLHLSECLTVHACDFHVAEHGLFHLHFCLMTTTITHPLSHATYKLRAADAAAAGTAFPPAEQVHTRYLCLSQTTTTLPLGFKLTLYTPTGP